MRSVLAPAVKSWRSAKAIALLATLAFAIGIAATTAIYTVVNTVMLGLLPYPDGDRFVAIYSARFNEPTLRGSLSLPDVVEYQRRTGSFDVFGGFRPGDANLRSPGEPQHVNVTAVTASLAHNIGVSPLVGRWFTDETDAVISNALWRRLGGDPNIVGQGMTLDERTLTITGVMPPGFRLPVGGIGTEGVLTDVWLYLDPLGRGEAPGQSLYFAYARRREGVTLAQAERDVKNAAAEIAKLNPATHPGYTARVDDLRESTFFTIRPTLLLLFAASVLLLLIACANVAGLLLARSVARARETATRVALGASRGQLALHYFVEGVLLSLAGGVAGVLLSIVLVRFVLSIASGYIPRASEIGIDSRVLLFGLGTAFLASALSSLAPLWQAFRTAPHEALSAGVRASASARARRLSQSLVVAEIALAFTLLAVSAVLIAHLRSLTRTSPGFDANNLLTFSLTIPESTSSSETARVSLQKRLTEALSAIPGVSSAGFGSGLPLTGCCFGGTIYAEGRTVDPGGVERTSFVFVNPQYLRTMGMPLRGGRLLTEGDTATDLVSVVINQAAATRNWPDRDPIDAYGRLNSPDGQRFQVVGVVGDIRNDGLGNPTVPELYMLNAIFPINPISAVVRSQLPAASIVPEIRRAVQRIDPTLPIYDLITMNDIIGDSVVLERVASFMTTFFAVAALLMATLGVYGVMSYSVRQRRVEIGTRMALGAVGRDLLALIVGGGLKMAAYGIAIGGVAIAAAVWTLVRLLDVHDVGWLPFASSAAVVTTVAAAASSFPAWRATRLSPMVAIRDETPSIWQSARRSIRRTMKEISRAVSGAEDSAAVVDGSLLTDFVAATRGAESFAEALRIALATLCERLGAQSALLLERVSTDEYRCTAIVPDNAASQCSLPAQGFLLNRLAYHASPLALTSGDLATLKRWAQEHRPQRLPEIQALEDSGARLAVSLRTKHEILGVLLLGPRTGRETYTTAERQLLRTCADQFALMIENARLTNRVVEQEKLRRDLALAAEVQRRLLPERPPQSSVAALTAMSLPARTVGGDYYDFINVRDGRIGIALADVAGKGVAAALIMSVVQASLRNIVSEGEVSLPQLAATMNRFLYRSTAANSYATFFYAQLDDRNRRLCYVNAGHNPPYLLRFPETSSGADDCGPVVEELATGGAVIGLFPEMSYEEATIDLRSDDVLVAFTDGVTEALNVDNEEFGEQRLKDLLRQIVHLSAQEISSRMAEALGNWIKGTSQYDDLTFVVMKVN